jgi:two-component system response regulator AlgR
MRLLIADDEPLARERLRRLVEEIPGCEVVGEACTGTETLLRAQRLRPDVLLLDIRMPGMDGLEAARHAAGMHNPPAVIFTTAYGDYALQAFDAQAVDYLLKPVQRARLEQALARVRRLSEADLTLLMQAMPAASGRTHLSARLHGRLQLLPVTQIRYFQADNKYVAAHFPGGELLLEDSLKTLEQEFGPRFLRIHRNALVAVPYIEALEQKAGGWRIKLAGMEALLEVSRRHLAGVRALLKAARRR